MAVNQEMLRKHAYFVTLWITWKTDIFDTAKVIKNMASAHEERRSELQDLKFATDVSVGATAYLIQNYCETLKLNVFRMKLVRFLSAKRKSGVLLDSASKPSYRFL